MPSTLDNGMVTTVFRTPRHGVVGWPTVIPTGTNYPTGIKVLVYFWLPEEAKIAIH